LCYYSGMPADMLAKWYYHTIPTLLHTWHLIWALLQIYFVTPMLEIPEKTPPTQKFFAHSAFSSSNNNYNSWMPIDYVFNSDLTNITIIPVSINPVLEVALFPLLWEFHCHASKRPLSYNEIIFFYGCIVMLYTGINFWSKQCSQKTLVYCNDFGKRNNFW